MAVKMKTSDTDLSALSGKEVESTLQSDAKRSFKPSRLGRSDSEALETIPQAKNN